MKSRSSVEGTKLGCFKRFGVISIAAAIALCLSTCAMFPAKYDLQKRDTAASSAATSDPATKGLSGERYDFLPWLHRQMQRDGARLPKTVLIVTASGGGTRAAGFTYKVLKQLNTVAMACPPWIDASSGCTALDRVLLISGVSGGNLTAARFALFGKKGLDQAFVDNVIKQNAFARGMTGFLNPEYWFDRTQQFVDILEMNYQIQGRVATFNDLNERVPFLIMAGTDVLGEEVFPLTQTAFDDLCADLDRLPVGVGVAAAGNFPFLLNGVHLENYHEVGGCSGNDWKQSYLIDTERLLRLAADPERRTTEANAARFRLWMRKALPANTVDPSGRPVRIENPEERSIKFLHLFDGGLADNLAIRPVVRNVINNKTLEMFAQDGVSNVVFVTINAARADKKDGLYQSRSGPNWIPSLAIDSVFSPMESNSEMTQFSLQRYLAAYFSQKDASDSSKLPSVEIIRFDPDLLYGDHRSELLREDFKKITIFATIDNHALDIFENAAKALQETAPCIAVLKNDSAEQDTLRGSACVIYRAGMKGDSGLYPEMRREDAFPPLRQN
jgi:hypothetical protein